MSEILTMAESLIPMIIELRHTTKNDRRIAPPIVSELVVPRIIGQLFRLVKAFGYVMKFRVDQRRVCFKAFRSPLFQATSSCVISCGEETDIELSSVA